MTEATWNAERLRTLRERLGWSGDKLASEINERSGMRANRHTVSRWEAGRVTIGYAACHALDRIEADYL